MRGAQIVDFKKEQLLSDVYRISGAGCRSFFVIDKNVYGLYIDLFSELEDGEYYIYDSDEENKNIYNVMPIYDALLKGGYQRSDVLVAIGGGIVGDISGFAASTYMRGIRLIHVPTTLLAMIDSSIGSKTGVNYMGIKNLVGSFYDAEVILQDPSFLDSLEDDEFGNGVAEMIKVASVLDRDFFDILEQSSKLNPTEQRREVAKQISLAQSLKRAVVDGDLLDKGARRALNFGHTIGHALESLSFGTDLIKGHGSAVAIGMCEMMRLSHSEKLSSLADLERLERVVSSFSLPTSIDISNQELFETMRKDKKRAAGLNHLVICPEIGTYEILSLDDRELQKFLNG